MKTHFTPGQKVSELIEADFSLLQVFLRIGLSLRYSDLTVEEACSKSGIDPTALLLICRVHAMPGYVPDSDEILTGDIRTVIGYLRDSHFYYNNDAMVRLEENARKLIESFPEKKKTVIWKFVQEYKNELEKHFEFEEREAFPYIEALLQGNSGKGFSIGCFEENHSNVEEKLDDLRNIVMKYLPEDCDNELRTRVLIGIYHLEEDLRKHTDIENTVLIPMARRIEYGR